MMKKTTQKKIKEYAAKGCTENGKQVIDITNAAASTIDRILSSLSVYELTASFGQFGKNAALYEARDRESGSIYQYVITDRNSNLMRMPY